MPSGYSSSQTYLDRPAHLFREGTCLYSNNYLFGKIDKKL